METPVADHPALFPHKICWKFASFHNGKFIEALKIRRSNRRSAEVQTFQKNGIFQLKKRPVMIALCVHDERKGFSATTLFRSLYFWGDFSPRIEKTRGNDRFMFLAKEKLEREMKFAPEKRRPLYCRAISKAISFYERISKRSVFFGGF